MVERGSSEGPLGISKWLLAVVTPVVVFLLLGAIGIPSALYAHSASRIDALQIKVSQTEIDNATLKNDMTYIKAALQRIESKLP
jgi:septal ring-binding cell division protein DamX